MENRLSAAVTGKKGRAGHSFVAEGQSPSWVVEVTPVTGLGALLIALQQTEDHKDTGRDPERCGRPS